jgi:K+-sensing histidine kinase KdpD
MDDSFTETGLKFFGTVSASISHEIKNRLAVINEQAGLLKDMVKLAEQGREMSLERLMRLAESLKNQVDLTDGIIRNMNRFAHSVDSFEHASDLNEILSLTASIAGRTASNKGVRIELQLPEVSPGIMSAPFLLIQLAWSCLEALMPFADMDSPIRMGCRKMDTGASIWFSVDRWPEVFPSELAGIVQPLLDSLGAVVTLMPDEKELRVDLRGKS